ncbi:MAG: universal stress protein [Alphaproteobacteria bacterium]|nr:universal stress protein [Alphaproteobacteria bacterium]
MSGAVGAIGVVLGGEGSEATCAAAAGLAKQFEASCDGVYPVWPADMPAAALGRAASGVVIAARREGQVRRAGEAEKKFKAAIAAAGVQGGFAMVEGDVPETLARASFNHDVLVVERVDPEDIDDVLEGTLHEQVALAAICPTLILPPGTGSVSLDHVGIAWKETREAARAVKEAMPFLLAAKKVSVLSVGAPTHVISYQGALITYLKRHGIDAASVEETVGHDEGHGLIDSAKKHGVTMMVMGLYSRPRWFELVLGGVTRRLVRENPFPILTSH